MSKSDISKASAVLIGLSILATSVGTIFAKDLQSTTGRLKIATVSAPTAVNKNQVLTNTSPAENRLAIIKDQMATREAALRLKLQSFKDQKKASAAARISTNLNQINQNQTSQMRRHLELMSVILDKLEARVNKPTPDIKNQVAARAAIASTRMMIATASAAVSTQAQRDYTIQVTSEAKIRLDAQAMRNKLHTDILTLRKIIIDTKQSVANSIRIAKSNSSENPEPKKEATTSGRK